MNQTLINLILALATNELIHNFMEVSNIRKKVTRLDTYIKKKPYKEDNMNIDTRAKSYSISVIIFVFMTGALFGVYSVFDISGDTALKTIIALLVASFFVTAVTVDKFHVEIEKVTKKFKK